MKPLRHSTTALRIQATLQTAQFSLTMHPVTLLQCVEPLLSTTDHLLISPNFFRLNTIYSYLINPIRIGNYLAT